MFEGGHGLMLSVCGELKTTDQMPAIQGVQTAKYDTREGEAFVRAWISGKKARYLHVDCARSVLFPTGETPKVTGKKEDILKLIESVSGIDLEATVCACFRVPLSVVPESGLIRSLLPEHKSDDVSMKMTGATFSLGGAPISRLQWRVLSTKDKQDMVHVDLRGDRRFQVSDKYLSEAWSWIYGQFSLFVLGQRKGGEIAP